MKYGPPGMTQERWDLYVKEQAALRGEPVEFTSEELGVLLEEAAVLDKHPDVIAGMR